MLVVYGTTAAVYGSSDLAGAKCGAQDVYAYSSDRAEYVLAGDAVACAYTRKVERDRS
jgi:hypothetical protein